MNQNYLINLETLNQNSYSKDCSNEEEKMFQIDTNQKFMAVYSTDDCRIELDEVLGWYEDNGDVKPLVLDQSGLIDPTICRNFLELMPKEKALHLQQTLQNKYLVNKIKKQYPHEIEDKMKQLNNLISIEGACHIVANEKGISII